MARIKSNTEGKLRIFRNFKQDYCMEGYLLLLPNLKHMSTIARFRMSSHTQYIRPSSNKKSFPVHRPGGLKRAYWNFLFHLFKNIFFFFTFPPVHSSLKKLKLGKKKKSRPPDWQFFSLPGPQETIFYLRVALAIETGRHDKPKIAKEERKCRYCNLDEVEDEKHFLLKCPLYNEERLSLFNSVV